MKILCRVPNVIERDALIHALRDGGVGAITPDRDVIVNLANEPNLSLEGASVLFEGYDICVPEEQWSAAQSLLTDFRRRHDVRPVISESEADAERTVDKAGSRFIACSLWSMLLPIVMNVAAIYWLFRSRNVVQQRPLMTIFALILNIFTFSLMLVAGVSLLSPTRGVGF